MIPSPLHNSLRARPARHRRIARSTFTLVELLVSLTVLTLMMLLLFRFVISTQRTWTLSEANRAMFDDQLVAMDIISRDLNSTVASSLLDQAIPLYIGDPDTDDFICCIVTDTTMNRNAKSRLCEVNYRVRNRQLERLTVTSDSPEWDFFNQTDTVNPTWVNRNASGYENILDDGVAELRIEFFKEINNTWQILPPGVYFNLPDGVYVTLVLFSPAQDPLAGNNPKASELTSAQTFSRVIFLDKLIKE